MYNIIPSNSTKTSSHGRVQTTTINIEDCARIIFIIPPDKSLNLNNMRINHETMRKRIYHTVDVVGEAIKRPVLNIKTHYKISVTQNPPNCGLENEGLGDQKSPPSTKGSLPYLRRNLHH
jgi:hypothetical protein